jgi:hypothetical protein
VELSLRHLLAVFAHHHQLVAALERAVGQVFGFAAAVVAFANDGRVVTKIYT